MKKREEENKQKEKHTMTVQAEVHRDTPRRLNADRKQKQPTQMLVRQGRFSINVENIDVNIEVLSPNAKKVLTAKIAKDVAEQFMAWNVCPVAHRAHVQALPRPQWASALPVPRAQPHMAQPPIVHPVVCPVVHPVAPRAQPCMAQPPIVHPVVCPVVCPVAPRAQPGMAQPPIVHPVVCPVIHLAAPRSCVQAPPRPPWASALPVPRPQSSDADTRRVSSAVHEMRFRANQLGNRCRHLPFELDKYMKEIVSKTKQLKKD